MISIVAVAVLFAAALFGMVFFRRQADPERSAAVAGAWEQALDGEKSAVLKSMMSLARPISALPQVHLKPETAAYRALRRKLVGAGGAFGGSVEVFLSMQALSCLISAGALIAAIAAKSSGALLLGVFVVAVAFCALPYNKLANEFKKRSDAVSTGLPEFAEMLLMPVSSGYGVLPALDFTASRLDGPVAAEVRTMLHLLSSRVVSEQQAFIEAGERLGASAAATFFNTLYQSYVEGVKVADNIRGQAEQLRQQAYEATRAKLKALPNKLVIIMGLHLIPFLFAVVLLPTFTALSAM